MHFFQTRISLWLICQSSSEEEEDCWPPPDLAPFLLLSEVWVTVAVAVAAVELAMAVALPAALGVTSSMPEMDGRPPPVRFIVDVGDDADTDWSAAADVVVDDVAAAAADVAVDGTLEGEFPPPPPKVVGAPGAWTSSWNSSLRGTVPTAETTMMERFEEETHKFGSKKQIIKIFSNENSRILVNFLSEVQIPQVSTTYL